MNPAITVIIPAYNSSATILRAINSVINQTFRDFELIVIDDGSTDKTLELLGYFEGNEHIRIISFKENRGVSGARNAGMREATGKYIAFLDADDYWLEDKLEKQFDFMERLEVPLSATGYFREDKETGARSLVVPKPSAGVHQMLQRNLIAQSTAMVRRDIVAGVAFENCAHEDYVFWVRVMMVTGMRVLFLQEALAIYTVWRQSRSGKKVMSAYWHWRNLRDDFQLPWGKSISLFFAYAFQSVAIRVAAKVIGGNRGNHRSG